MFALLQLPLEAEIHNMGILWAFQLSQPNRNLGERHKLPQRGQRRSPGPKRVLVHLEVEKTHLMAINFVFLRQIFIHIFTTGNQCGRSSTFTQKFPGGPIKLQISRTSRRVFKFQEISRISRNCRHPAQWILKFCEIHTKLKPDDSSVIQYCIVHVQSVALKLPLQMSTQNYICLCQLIPVAVKLVK